MRKILFITQVDEDMINYHLPYLKLFKERGYDVHLACHGNKFNTYVDKTFEIPFIESITDFQKLTTTYKLIKKITKENDYSLIHCYSSILGGLTRFASIPLRKQGTKILYTAYNFSFYEGAPISQWLISFPIEKMLSKHTDILIITNEEDYQTTIKYHFKAEEIKLVLGLGIDLMTYLPEGLESKKILRQRNNINETDFVLIYISELTLNPNQKDLITMMAVVSEELPEVKLLIVGKGKERDYYKELVKKKGLEGHVKFLGNRQDIAEILKLADVSLFTSKCKNPIHIYKAMAMKKPLIVSNDKAFKNIVVDKENGYVVNNLKELIAAVFLLYRFRDKAITYGNINRLKVKKHSSSLIQKEMKEIYLNVLVKK